MLAPTLVDMPDPSSTLARTRPAGGDRCPGALRLHEAADGPLARVRVPGGRLAVAQVRALADAADAVGDARLHLTSRGNVELRAVRDAQHLTQALFDAGLLPSVAHERVRNVLASPAAGLDPLVRQLDAAICADPLLTGLSGRFAFGLDDGSGAMLSLRPDLAVVVRGDDRAVVVLGGTSSGYGVPAAGVVAALTSAARAFLAHADGAWRVCDLPVDHPAITAMREAVRSLPGAAPDDAPLPLDAGHGPAAGVTRSGDDVVLVAGVPLGTADTDMWRTIAQVAEEGDGAVRVSPWRRVVLAGVSAERAPEGAAALRRAGLVLDDDPLLGLGACTGRPGCAKALADVRADALSSLDAADAADEGAVRRAGLTRLPSREHPVYWAGCARACGHPVGAHTRVVATEAGYTLEVHR